MLWCSSFAIIAGFPSQDKKLLDSLYFQSSLKTSKKNFISGSLMCFQIDIVLVSEVKRISQKLIHPSYFPSFRGSSSESFLYKRCFLNFLKIHRKTIVVKSLFHKVAGLPLENLVKKRLQYSCFPGSFMNYLIMLFLHKFAR